MRNHNKYTVEELPLNAKKCYLYTTNILDHHFILNFPPADLPGFTDPHIPLVAREIMQRMIRQFAAEYTSKTSSTQDVPNPQSQPNGTKDQSLPKAPSLEPDASTPAPVCGGAGTGTAASAQNPVLSKLLMADQDSPLDLTVKKPETEPSDQGKTDAKFR